MRFKSQADADAYAAKNPQAGPTKIPKLAAKAGFKGPKSLAAHVKSNPNSLAARRGMGSAQDAQEKGGGNPAANKPRVTPADMPDPRDMPRKPVPTGPQKPPTSPPGHIYGNPGRTMNPGGQAPNAGPRPRGGSGGIYANPNQGNPWGPGAEAGKADVVDPQVRAMNPHPNNPYAINGGGGRFGQHLPVSNGGLQGVPRGDNPAGSDPNGSVDSGSMGTMGGLADAVGMGPRQGMPMPGPGPMPGPPTGAGGTMRMQPIPMTPRPFGPQGGGGMDQGGQGTGFVPDIPNPQGAARQQMAGNLRRRNVPMPPPMNNPGGPATGGAY